MPIPALVLRVRHVPTPGIADEHVEPLLLRSHLVEQRLHPIVISVIAPNRDSTTTGCGHLIGGVLDGVRILGDGRPPAYRSPGDIDRSSMLSKNTSNSTAGTTTGTRHHRNLSR